MKAFLLAAGIGSRLRPLTDRMPKCLVPIGGEPLLGIWLRQLRRHGVSAVLINTPHLAEQVRDYVQTPAAAGLDIRLFHEPALLGSAGTVAANRDFVAGEESFLIVYADNLTNLDLPAMQRFHDRRRSEFTLGLFETAQPSQCGIVVCDADGRVREFQEKPATPKSNLANGGIYLATPALFEVMPDRQVLDFGYDVLPLMIGRLFGYRMRGFFCDIGTLERLEWARREWPKVEAAC